MARRWLRKDLGQGQGPGDRGAKPHLLKNRRFLKPPAEQHRDEAKQAAEDEGNPPEALCNPDIAERHGQAGGDQRAEENAAGQAAGKQAHGESGPAWRALGDNTQPPGASPPMAMPCMMRIASRRRGAPIPIGE